MGGFRPTQSWHKPLITSFWVFLDQHKVTQSRHKPLITSFWVFLDQHKVPKSRHKVLRGLCQLCVGQKRPRNEL